VLQSVAIRDSYNIAADDGKFPFWWGLQQFNIHNVKTV